MDESLLTDGERREIINTLPIGQGAVGALLKAQLAKARPIIEKQERERIITYIRENYIPGKDTEILIADLQGLREEE